MSQSMKTTGSQTKSSVLAPFRFALYHIKTFYLFTKSDIKTMLLPNSCITFALTRQTSPVQLSNTVLWTWLLLLTFSVSNQASVQSLVEDQINKAWRPIPSSRITITQARKLRWVLVFLSLLASGYHGNLVAAAIILMADVVYNDLGFSTWWFTKSLLNAVGYVGFQYGAVTIALATNRSIDNQVFGSIITFGLLVFTTTHVQDFYDAEGDQAIGRQTAATLYPNISRVLAAISIAAWAMALPIIWDIALIPSTIFTLLGTFVAGRFIFLGGHKSDEMSFLHYNIWILFGCILPAFREVKYLA